MTVPDPVALLRRGAAGGAGRGGDRGRRAACARSPQLPGAVWERVGGAPQRPGHRDPDDQQAEPELLRREPGQAARRRAAAARGAGARGCGRSREFLASIGIPRGILHDGGRLGDEPRQPASPPRALTTLLRHMFFHPAGDGVRPVAPLRRRGHGILEAAVRRPALPRQRLRQDRHPRRASRPSPATPRRSPASPTPSRSCSTAAGGDAHGAQDRIVMALIDNG